MSQLVLYGSAPLCLKTRTMQSTLGRRKGGEIVKDLGDLESFPALLTESRHSQKHGVILGVVLCRPGVGLDDPSKPGHSRNL